jgi:hypothetical protein
MEDMTQGSGKAAAMPCSLLALSRHALALVSLDMCGHAWALVLADALALVASCTLRPALLLFGLSCWCGIRGVEGGWWLWWRKC